MVLGHSLLISICIVGLRVCRVLVVGSRNVLHCGCTPT